MLTQSATSSPFDLSGDSSLWKDVALPGDLPPTRGHFLDFFSEHMIVLGKYGFPFVIIVDSR